jgi:hypothetical protein
MMTKGKKENQGEQQGKGEIPDKRVLRYIPEWRAIAGTISATVVMCQLEYWFDLQPEGIYKFLESCGHNLHRDGDSWAKELAFSADEFRTAFAAIGKHYKKKGLYDEAKARGEIYTSDDGRQRLYASYYQRREHVTYYSRNHSYADAMIQAVRTGKPGMPVSPRSGKPVSRNREGRFRKTGNAGLAYTETTPETTAQTTPDILSTAVLPAHGERGCGEASRNIYVDGSDIQEETYAVMGKGGSDARGWARASSGDQVA